MAAETEIASRQRLPASAGRKNGASGASAGATGRWAPVIGGAALALAGGSVIYRSVTGRWPVPGAMGASPSAPGEPGGRIEKSFTINRPREELYRFWHDFENLPRFMKYLDSVQVSNGTSHWVAKAPTGQRVEWDAQITDERQNEFIAWQSLPGSNIDVNGWVRFRPAPGGRGTVVTVALQYAPPGGAAGAAMGRLFGAVPERLVEEDLRRFKEVMEAGEIPTIAGQPHG